MIVLVLVPRPRLWAARRIEDDGRSTADEADSQGNAARQAAPRAASWFNSRVATAAKRQPASKPSANSRRRREISREEFAGAVLIVVLIGIAYFPCLSGGFVLDDDNLLTKSPLIRASDGLYRFWFTSEPFDYWPVSNTLLWIEWRLWGMHSSGYHIVNLLLHVAAVFLVWGILRRLQVPAALFAALLFAVHPVNVETVAWIAQAKTLLAMLFSLLAVFSYLHGEACSEQTTDRWYWGSLVAFALAMLSKVSAAPTPLLLLTILCWLRPLTARDLWRLAPFFTLVLVLVPVNVWFRTHGLVVDTPSVGVLERLLGAASVVWFYLGKAIAPVNLTLIYPEWHVDAGHPWWWIGLAASAGLTLLLWTYRTRGSRSLLFAWIYFCASLLPVLGLTDVGYKQHLVVADHYLNAGLIVVCALAAAAGSAGKQRVPARLRRCADAAAILLVGLFTLLSWRQSSLYADGTLLYTDTLAKNPGAWIAHTNLGSILAEADHAAEAKEHYREALRLKPANPEAHVLLGRALAKEGNLSEAMQHFEEALRTRPNMPEAHSNLALALTELGRSDEARAHLEHALQVNPDFAEAHNNLGLELARAGKAREAMAQYREALRLDPELPEVYNNMASLLVESGDLAAAIDQAQRALQLKPNLAEAHYNLANALLRRGKVNEAITHYREALRLRPAYAEAHSNLGTALAESGDLDQADKHYREALRLKPDFADARNNLAIITEMRTGSKQQPTAD